MRRRAKQLSEAQVYVSVDLQLTDAQAFGSQLRQLAGSLEEGNGAHSGCVDVDLDIAAEYLRRLADSPKALSALFAGSALGVSLHPGKTGAPRRNSARDRGIALEYWTRRRINARRRGLAARDLHTVAARWEVTDKTAD